MSPGLAWLLVLVPWAPQDADAELERRVAELDSAREPGWNAALEELVALEERASTRVLVGFEQLDFSARRGRARLLERIPPAAGLEPLLALAEADPDPEVRRTLASALGSPALAETREDERVAVLERLAVNDPDLAVRAQARAALAECGLASAIRSLERLLTELPAAEAEEAAGALAPLHAARTRSIALVREAFAGERRLSDGTLAALLRGYGRALSEVPHGGEELPERLPLLAGLRHPSLEVQAAARQALSGFVARAAELFEDERVDRVLARLGEEGLPEVECLRRRIDVAWLQRGDAALALELARELARCAQGLAPEEAEAWEQHARLLEGAALFALGRTDEAAALLDELAAQLDAGRAEREDLFPVAHAGERGPDGRTVRWTQGGGVAFLSRLQLSAAAHLWLATVALGRKGSDAEVLEELRTVHSLFLETRVVAMRTGTTDPGSLDAVLAGPVSPFLLVFSNERFAPAERGRTLDLALALGNAFARVAPLEVLGFEGGAEGGAAPARELADVFVDPVRRAWLLELRAAEVRELQDEIQRLRDDTEVGPQDPELRRQVLRVRYYRLHELDEAERAERQALAETQRGAGLEAVASAELRSIHAQLLEYLSPCTHAHALAGELLSEGRRAEARGLCERALATLGTAPLGGGGPGNEFTSARFELMLGSIAMDERRPADAERAYQAGERRLAAIETSLEEARAATGDAEARRSYGAQLRMVREMRGEAFLSQAVNANVGMGRPDLALGHFEQAYELNQNAFMRVLRACYRARSGKAAEARNVLRGVAPAPQLFYNFACTHALLGESEQALEFLERDLTENHPSAGARAQRIEWMRADPDLASLRGHPRFERMLGGGG